MQTSIRPKNPLHILVFLLLFATSFFYSEKLFAGTCTLSGDATVSQAQLITCGGGSLTGLIIDSGVNISLSDAITVDGDITLNGTITQVAENTTGVSITAHNINIAASAAIDVIGKGCPGSDGGDGFYAKGPDPTNSNLCEYRATGAGGYQYGGGNHGGLGGGTFLDYTPETYDSQSAPSLLGSGGGGANGGAGAGGGLIYLDVSNTLTVDGGIYAHGQNGGGSQSGGSGGSIHIHTATLAGSGNISANGGNGDTYGGGGGGGRIALYYNTLSSFNLANVVALGGTGGVSLTSQKGTTFILDRKTDDGSGNLTVTSGLQFVDGDDFTRTSIYIYDDALLTCQDQTTLNIGATGSYTDLGSVWSCTSSIGTINLNVGGTLSATGITWTVSNTDTFNLTAGLFSNSGTNLFTFNKAGSRAYWNISNDLTLNNFTYTGGSAGFSSYLGGTLFIDDAIDISLVSSNIASSISWTGISSLSLDSNSSINASGKGCAGSISGLDGYGPNLQNSYWACQTGDTTGVVGAGLAQYGGAGHCSAGEGSYGPASTTYDYFASPSLPGSGGGGYSGSGAASYGGGMVRLSILGTLTLNGNISVNAGSSGGAQAGGSGGSAWVDASTVTGSGSISANGMSGNGYGAPGGAGYIALYYDTLDGFNSSQLQSNGITGRTADCTPYLALNPKLSLSKTTVTTSEAGGQDSFTVALTTQPTSDVTVNILSSDTNAGTVSPSSLTFTSSDWNVAQTVTVTGVDEHIAGGTTAYDIDLTAVSVDSNYDGKTAQVTANNSDDDTAGVNVDTNTLNLVGDETGTVNIVLNTIPTQSVTISPSYNSAELTVSPASITFLPADWNTPQSFSVQAASSVAPESTVTTSLSFSASSSDSNYNAIAIASVTVELSNNDLPEIVIPDPSSDPAAVTQSGNIVSYSISLNSPSSQTVSIQYQTANGTAEAGVDYMASSGSLVWNPGETGTRNVEVELLGDWTLASNIIDEGFSLSLISTAHAETIQKTILLQFSDATNANASNSSISLTIQQNSGVPLPVEGSGCNLSKNSPLSSLCSWLVFAGIIFALKFVSKKISRI